MKVFFRRNDNGDAYPPAARYWLCLPLLCLLLSCFGDDPSGVGPLPGGYLLVPAATFRMGEPVFPGETEGTRLVSLRRSFIIARDELTLADYLPVLNRAWRRAELILEDAVLHESIRQEALLLLEPGVEIFYHAAADSFALTEGCDPRLPLRRLTWFGAATYCDWLNHEQGLPASYARTAFDWPCGPGGDCYLAEGWRLPTEAEWELAARFPAFGAYPWGDGDPDCLRANGRPGPVEAPCEGDTRPAGHGQGAGDSWLGAREMAGNVAEWCQDWCRNPDGDDYADWEFHDSLVDPVNPDVDMFGALLYKALRGGSYDSPFVDQAAWTRSCRSPDLVSLDGNAGIGVRLARSWSH